MAEWVLTREDLEEWYDQLNEVCFDNILPRCTFYIGLCRDADCPDFDYVALYYGDSVGSGTIFINPSYIDDPWDALAALAHEMIHQWQDLCWLRLDHRAVFKAWCDRITELTGLEP